MSIPATVLVPVAVDPAALGDHPTARDGLIHRQIARTLEAHGILTLGNQDGDMLHAAIAALDANSRETWDLLIKGLSSMNRVDTDLRGMPTARALDLLGSSNETAQLIRVFVASQNAAGAKQVDYVSGYRTINGTDIVLAATIDKSPALVDAQKVGKFPPGTNRSDVGDGILRPAAARSGRVMVLDPHLFDDILGTARGSQRDHVEWLVEVMASSLRPGSNLVLVADFPNGRRRDNRPLTINLAKQEIEVAVRKGLALRTEQITVVVTLVQGPKREVKMSNRYLHFDCGVAFEVSHDILRLGSQTNPAPDHLTFRRLDPSETEHVTRIAAGYTGYTPETARVQWAMQIP
ncbi:hypothetical protein [Glaciibacter sp. 2TAF33]|uniref:hypothetical protein n=1 Tax=Glaciibacter sp. 2TAF33 TaxID=3233015 RepID=UPI003F93A272